MSAEKSADQTIHKGLGDVVEDRTAIAAIVPETNSLTYRGYPVQELAQQCGFEEVAYLLWYGELPDAGRKVMGFGHRVYKNGDSRVPTMREALGNIAARRDDGDGWLEMYETLAQAMQREKGLEPNVDYPVGLALYLLGIDIEMFTPIFVMGRIVGWSAHVIEQRGANRLIRPSARYAGPAQREVPATER